MSRREDEPRSRGASWRLSALHEKIGHFYYSHCLFCSTYPITVISVAITVALICWWVVFLLLAAGICHHYIMEMMFPSIDYFLNYLCINVYCCATCDSRWKLLCLLVYYRLRWCDKCYLKIFKCFDLFGLKTVIFWNIWTLDWIGRRCEHCSAIFWPFLAKV